MNDLEKTTTALNTQKGSYQANLVAINSQYHDAHDAFAAANNSNNKAAKEENEGLAMAK